MQRFNVAQVRVALNLFTKTGMLPSRNVRLQDLLALATKYTGVTYSRNRSGAYAAITKLDELLK